MGLLIELIVVVVILKLNHFISKRYYTRRKYDIIYELLLLVFYMISKGIDRFLLQVLFMSLLVIPILFVLLISVKENIKRVFSVVMVVLILLINNLIFDLIRSNIAVERFGVSMITISHEGRKEYLLDQDIIDYMVNEINDNNYNKEGLLLLPYSDSIEIIFYDDEKEVIDTLIVLNDTHINKGLFIYRTKTQIPIEYLMELLE